MNGLKKVRFLAIILILVLTSFSIIEGEGTGESRAPIFTMTDIHVNVTYPDGGEASGVYVKVHRDGYEYTWYRAESGYTNSSGQDWIPITSYNMGPCHLTVYNNSRSSFTSIPIHIWPDEVTYHDVVLTPTLPHINVISGRILNRSGGAPVAQPTSISASVTDSNGLRFDVFNTTMADGSFELKVPNSSLPVRIQPIVLNSSESYLYYDTDIFLKKDEHSYPLDIWLTPKIEADVPVTLRFFDSSPKEPLPDIFASYYSGSEAFSDHHEIEKSIFSGTDGDGFLNMTMGHGEYIFSLSMDFNEEEYIQMLFDLPLIVNDTALYQEIEIPAPNDFRTVTLQINSSETGDPIWGAQTDFNYRTTMDGFSMDFSTYTESNSSGSMSFSLLPDIDVDIMVYSWGYEDRVITIDAGPASSDIFLEVDLEPAIPTEAPMINLSAFVNDEVSELPIPDAVIQGTGSYQGARVGFYGRTENDGYYNGSIYAGTYDIVVSSSLGTADLMDHVIPPYQNHSFNISLERSDFKDPFNEIEFRLVDPSGNPLDGQPVEISNYDFYLDHDLISDEDGIVRANLRPGTYNLENLDNSGFMSIYRPHWVIPIGTTIEVENDGAYGDIILYPSDPLDEISGFIRDKDTGDPVPFAKVRSKAYHPLQVEDTRNGLSYDTILDEEKVLLYEQGSGSNVDGFYRVWGRETVMLECYKEGYFPLFETLDLATRAVNQHDIIIERIPEITTWVNGTLVGKNGDPVEGVVNLFDREYDHYKIGTFSTGQDGNFSIPCYEGEILVEFFNLTLQGELLLTVPEEGIEDLILQLIPMTTISGVIRSPLGEPIEDASITVAEVTGNITLIEYINSNEMGEFRIDVEAGIYRLAIQGPDEYDGYLSEHLVATGWNDIELEIFLQNRTYALEVWGSVIGEGGPFNNQSISAVEIILYDKDDDIIDTTVTDHSGEFIFELIEYGNYSIKAEPTGNMLAREEFYKSGYLPVRSNEFIVSDITVEKNLYLPFASYTPPGTFNITGHSPRGMNVSTVEPIRLWFSKPVNETMLISALAIDPEVQNLSFRFNKLGTALAIFHDAFLENTTYRISLSPLILSNEGFPIEFEGDMFEWEFTTGTTNVRWGLYSSVITIDYDKSWNITVTGGPGQDVYIILEDVSSFKLDESRGEGYFSVYTIFLEGDSFEWNTTYWFHYSNVENGPDLAVELSGWRHMPDEGEGVIPPPEWEISSADVSLDENGDWEIKVEGNEGLDVFIVLPGLGSFLLTETGAGVYEITINVTNFDGGKEYTYYFSNSTSGENRAPELGGSLQAKVVEIEDEGEKKERSLLWLLLLIIGILLILIAVAIVIVTIRKQGEEEVMDWGEE